MRLFTKAAGRARRQQLVELANAVRAGFATREGYEEWIEHMTAPLN